MNEKETQAVINAATAYKNMIVGMYEGSDMPANSMTIVEIIDTLLATLAENTRLRAAIEKATDVMCVAQIDGRYQTAFQGLMEAIDE